MKASNVRLLIVATVVTQLFGAILLLLVARGVSHNAVPMVLTQDVSRQVQDRELPSYLNCSSFPFEFAIGDSGAVQVLGVATEHLTTARASDFTDAMTGPFNSFDVNVKITYDTVRSVFNSSAAYNFTSTLVLREQQKTKNYPLACNHSGSVSDTGESANECWLWNKTTSVCLGIDNGQGNSFEVFTSFCDSEVSTLAWYEWDTSKNGTVNYEILYNAILSLASLVESYALPCTSSITVNADYLASADSKVDAALQYISYVYFALIVVFGAWVCVLVMKETRAPQTQLETKV